jgi:poly(3-hydroxyalkanoate) synthetase
LVEAAAADDTDGGKVLIHVAQASSLRTDQRKLEACATLILFAGHHAIIVSPPARQSNTQTESSVVS